MVVDGMGVIVMVVEGEGVMVVFVVVVIER